MPRKFSAAIRWISGQSPRPFLFVARLIMQIADYELVICNLSRLVKVSQNEF
jgi:hypothetical protein